MKRVFVVAVLLLVAYSALALRLFQLQVLSHRHYSALCNAQRRGREVLPARRGDISSSDGIVLARSIPSFGLFIDSAFVENASSLLAILKPICHLSRQEVARILREIKGRKRFIWVRRHITPKQRRIIRALKLHGTFFTSLWRRVYPLGSFAANVLGFCGIDGQGLAGVEFWAERWLRGRDGLHIFERDGCGRRLFVDDQFRPPVDGAEVELTIDGVVQEIAEQAAQDAWLKWKPNWVAVVVAQPHTGFILAYAVRPSFDPTRWSSFPQKSRRNPAAEFVYEPGSTFKPFTFAMLLQEKLVRLDEKIDCEKGAWRIGRRILHDYHGYGVLSVPDVLAKSSNIGTAKLALRIPPDHHHRWLRRFGFGQKTGIELPHEESGVLRDVSRWSRYSQVSLAMGQEVGVTVLQMVRGFCAIAADGVLPSLHIVRRITAPSGKILYQARTRGRRTIDPDIATTLRALLARVVENGTGRRAKSRLFTIAGKTGTAQKLDRKTGRYSQKDYVASFVCMAPAKRPKIVVAVVVDTPRGRSHFGGTVAAPFAKTVAEQTLLYLGVAPDKEEKHATEKALKGSCRKMDKEARARNRHHR